VKTNAHKNRDSVEKVNKIAYTHKKAITMQQIQKILQNNLPATAFITHIIQNPEVLEAKTSHGNNILHLCVTMNKIDMAINLLTYLQVQIEKNQYNDAGRALAQMHSLLITLNHKGVSALHIAAMYGHSELFHWICHHGYDLTMINLSLSHKDRQHNTVMHIVLQKIIEREQRNLKEKRQDISEHDCIISIILRGLSTNNIETILLYRYAESQIKPKKQDDIHIEVAAIMSVERLETCILAPEEAQIIIQKIHEEMLEILYISNDRGYTPIHLAIQTSKPLIAHLLLANITSFRISQILNVRVNEDRYLLEDLYERGYTKTAIMHSILLLCKQFDNGDYCPAVFNTFFDSIFRFRDYVEDKEGQSFDQLTSTIMRILNTYLEKYASNLMQGKHFIDENGDKVTITAIKAYMPKAFSLFTDNQKTGNTAAASKSRK